MDERGAPQELVNHLEGWARMRKGEGREEMRGGGGEEGMGMWGDAGKGKAYRLP